MAIETARRFCEDRPQRPRQSSAGPHTTDAAGVLVGAATVPGAFSDDVHDDLQRRLVSPLSPMLLSLKDLFDSIVAPEHAAPPELAERQLRLASAVLLVEVMRCDGKVESAELETVLGALRARFALSKDEGEQLIELARQTSRGATDYFTFTSRINDSFSVEQKLRMIENMWKVAYADGVLSADENHVMHKISELLYVPHGAYIAAKLRAKAAAGVD